MSPPFAVRGLGEIAIRCADLGAMFAFYRDVIGLAVLRPPQGGIAFFSLGAGHAGHITVLALFRGEAGAPPAAGAGSSLHHLALDVDFDAQEAAIAWLAAQGLTPRVEIFGWVGWRGVFVTDPEGNTVELVAHHPSLISPG